MALSFEKIVTSPVFTFVVGAERTPVALHNALVSHHSSTLNSLMNGAMSEAKAGQADMIDVDVDAFVHFSQWLYTGRYGLPYCRGSSQMCLEIKSEGEIFSWDHGLTTVERRQKAKSMKLDGIWDDRITQEAIDGMAASLESVHSARKQNLWETFIHHSGYELAAPRRKNPQEIKVDWTKIFLGHARLYCFADTYGIASLQELCWKAVRAALSDFECQGKQVDVLVQLITYTMENTPSTNVHNGRGLRNVILDYAVIVFEILIVNKSFQDLLRENHDLAVDLLTLLPRRFI